MSLSLADQIIAVEIAAFEASAPDHKQALQDAVKTLQFEERRRQSASEALERLIAREAALKAQDDLIGPRANLRTPWVAP